MSRPHCWASLPCRMCHLEESVQDFMSVKVVLYWTELRLRTFTGCEGVFIAWCEPSRRTSGARRRKTREPRKVCGCSTCVTTMPPAPKDTALGSVAAPKEETPGSAMLPGVRQDEAVKAASRKQVAKTRGDFGIRQRMQPVFHGVTAFVRQIAHTLVGGLGEFGEPLLDVFQKA